MIKNIIDGFNDLPDGISFSIIYSSFVGYLFLFAAIGIYFTYIFIALIVVKIIAFIFYLYKRGEKVNKVVDTNE